MEYREIRVRRQLVILITDIALEVSQVQGPCFADRLTVRGVRSCHEIDMKRGAVGSFKVGEAEDALTIGEAIDGRSSLALMVDRVKFADRQNGRRLLCESM